MSAARPKYRLFESTGFLYPDPFPAFADSDDFDALTAWAVDHNDWKGTRTVALIVSDGGRFWKVHRDGRAVPISNVPAQPGRLSQEDRYAMRLARGPLPNDDRYELPPRETWGHRTIHVSAAMRGRTYD